MAENTRDANSVNELTDARRVARKAEVADAAAADLVDASRKADAGDVSPHLGGRAQPGDVLGLETGGETTGLGDTAEDENENRRSATKP